MDACKEEILYRFDPQVEQVSSYPFHVTVALAHPRALEKRRRDGAINDASWRTLGLTVDCGLNLLPDSPELYLTKEALTERLRRRLSTDYFGKALFKFDPSITTLSWHEYMAHRDDFREVTQRLFSRLIARAPALYTGMDGAHHDENGWCELCSQQQADEPEVSALDEPMMPREHMSQGGNSSSLANQQLCPSEERKQEQPSKMMSLPEYIRSE